MIVSLFSFCPTKDVENYTIILEPKPKEEKIFLLLKHLSKVRFSEIADKSVVINGLSMKKVAFAIRNGYLINIYTLENITDIRKIFKPELVKLSDKNVLLRAERLFLKPREAVKLITVELL